MYWEGIWNTQVCWKKTLIAGVAGKESQLWLRQKKYLLTYRTKVISSQTAGFLGTIGKWSYKKTTRQKNPKKPQNPNSYTWRSIHFQKKGKIISNQPSPALLAGSFLLESESGLLIFTRLLLPLSWPRKKNIWLGPTWKILTKSFF